MRIEQVELANNILKVNLSGALDIAGAGDIEVPMAVIGGSRTKVAVDFTGVSFLASIGIRVLVKTARAISNKGGRLVIVNPSEEARRVLTSTGIDAIIPIVSNEAEAVAKLA